VIEVVGRAGKNVVTCGSGQAKGEADTLELEGVELRFFNCNEPRNGPCHTAGSQAGNELYTAFLDGELGYINKAKKEVGVNLRNIHGPFITFTCETKGKSDLTFVVRGSVIGVLTPVGPPPVTKLTLTFTQAGGAQTPTKLEGNRAEQLTTTTDIRGVPQEIAINTGLAMTETLTMEQAIEVRG
jgi:hypothetical protein